MAIASGAFLRVEIPIVEKEDEFVLYTDCDVMFLQEPLVENFKPEYFSCAPKRYILNPTDINFGVMIMNVPNLRRNLVKFTQFIVENFLSFDAFDQDAFRQYHESKYDHLPPEFNWKPYWGPNSNAAIVHFHGPKPVIIRKLFEQPNSAVPPILRELFDESTIGYQQFLAEWDRFRAMIPQNLT